MKVYLIVRRAHGEGGEVLKVYKNVWRADETLTLLGKTGDKYYEYVLEEHEVVE